MGENTYMFVKLITLLFWTNEFHLIKSPLQVPSETSWSVLWSQQTGFMHVIDIILVFLFFPLIQSMHLLKSWLQIYEWII